MGEENVKLSDLEKDALKETANIGAGHASTALSEIVKKKVNLVVSDIDFISIKDIQSEIQGPQKLVVGIYTPIIKDMKGTIITIFNTESAINLARVADIAKNPELIARDFIITDADKETLKVIGNVISESYIKSLNTFLEMDMAYDKTNIISTFGESIIDLITLSIDPDAKDALLIMNEFNVEMTKIQGQFILLLGIKSLDSVLQRIRQKLD